MEPIVSIIILNWNGFQHLNECLTSLKKQTFKNFECIMVDNGSTDGSLDYLEKNHQWLKLIKLEKNIGFSAGNNVGLKNSLGKYIVTLNNDTAVDSNWLRELVKIAEKNPKAGMFASRICSYHDKDTIDSLGMQICLDGMSRGAFRGKKYSMLKHVPFKILLPSACAALYKREMLDQTGFFDESFFAYCEDTDLGLRGIRFGWESVLAKDAIVFHKYSSTAGSFSPFKIYLVERNHFWCSAKNLPLILLILLPLTTLFRYIFQAIILLGGHGSGNEFKQSDARIKCFLAFSKGVFHGIFYSWKKILKRFGYLNAWKIKDAEMTKKIIRHRLSFPKLLDCQEK